MPCSYCGEDKRIMAKGLCSPCYQRQWSTGSPARKIGSNVGKTCTIDGCLEAAAVRGVCRTHYSRLRHPLKTTWTLIRRRHPQELWPEAWNRFESFLADVGERPDGRSQLRRVNNDEPWSKDNVRWLKPVYSHSYPPEKMRGYQQAWRWRRVFGLDVEDYGRMLEDQGGVCAICGGKQDINKKTGKPRQLGVDHCHTTMKVRGLLCVNCNRALGYFSDDIDRLRAAIAYLEKHSTEEAA